MTRISLSQSELRQQPRPAAVWLRTYWDLLLSLGVGVLLILIVYITNFGAVMLNPLRAALGLGYVFLVPGYALQAALFPRPADLDRVSRLALATGLSVAVLPPVILVLDSLPWGIRTWPALFGLNLITLLCVLIAALRRGRSSLQEVEASQAFFLNKPALKLWCSGLSTPMRRLYVAMAAALLIALLSIAALIFLPRPDEYFTEFYILGAQGQVSDYPREVVAGQPFEIRTGIRNLENADKTYRVEVTSFDQVIAQTDEFTVRTGEVVEGPFSLSLPIPGEDVPVNFHLYQIGQTKAYRTLRLWIEVRPAP